MKFFNTENELQDYRESGDWALVSEDTPLLAHLTILENIALLREFHHGEKLPRAEEKARQLLIDCGYSHIAGQKPFERDHKENFVARYIRAVASDFDKILVVSPFSQTKNAGIMNLLQNLAAFFPQKDVEIIDLKANKRYYEG